MKKDEIVSILKKKGLRATKFRKDILSILSKKYPLTIDEILGVFEKRSSSPHFTTIYRELKTLGTNDIIGVCEVQGKKEYSLKNNEVVAHCTDCNTTTPLASDTYSEIKMIQDKLRKNSGFKVFTNGHIHGVCPACNPSS